MNAPVRCSLSFVTAADSTPGVAHADRQRVNFRPADLARLNGFVEMPDARVDYRTEGGCLYRGETLIRDMSDMTFQPLRAPYDHRAETGVADPPWHPLDRNQ